jgi:hypothetical protein
MQESATEDGLERALYFFEYVDRDARSVLAILSEPHAGIFQGATDVALAEAERFRSRLHVETLGLDIGKDVAIEVGKPNDRGYAVFIPIRWRAASQAALFPTLEAELEIAPLSDDPAHPMTQISILGRYRPPVGPFGAIGDAVIGHRIAEATVRNFVRDLATRLQRD